VSPDINHYAASAKLLGARQKRGTWEHLCSKGRHLIADGPFKALLGGMSSDAGVAVASCIRAHYGFVLWKGGNFVKIPVQDTPAAAVFPPCVSFTFSHTPPP